MKIQYCSDLHLEFASNLQFIFAYPIQPVADILLLAGDIVPLMTYQQSKYSFFWDYLDANFKQVYWIPGNHEYYGYNIDPWDITSIKPRIRPNIQLVYNKSFQLAEDIRLICSTLWTSISPNNRFAVENGMSDFDAITFEFRKFNADDYNFLHAQCLQFITDELKAYDGQKKIVMSHHVPTLLNYPEQYKTSKLNQGFAVELFPMIEESGPDVWLYGHHHQNIPPFTIGETLLVNNQLGYIQLKEHYQYKHNATFEI